MILEYTNDYNGLVLFYKKLEEISTILKEGRTTQARVMNFILTVLNYMILKVDDQACPNEFPISIFNDKSMQALRNDLENLLYFKTKFFNFLILELLLEAVRKENNVKPFVDAANRQWNKVVFQKRVKAIVKFLIFRKVKKSYLYDENDMSDWFSCKQKVRIVLNSEINSGDDFIMNKNNLKDNRENDIVNCACYKRKSQCTNNVKIFKNYSNTKFNFYEISMYTCIRHLCAKIYCLFRLTIFIYGWLTIFMNYCYRSLQLIFLNVIHKSIDEQS